MKLYSTLILITLYFTKGIAQAEIGDSHIDFLRNQGLPNCIHLKYSREYSNILAQATKRINDIHSEITQSFVVTPKSEQFAYLLLLGKKQYLYYGDSLYSSCIITVEVDSNGLIRIPARGRNYQTSDMLNNMTVICDKQIVSLQRAKKVSLPYWNDYKFHPKESILKYDIRHGKFYWILTGYKKSDERIILIDAITGDYAETWNNEY